jgi:hypothetical protein
VGVIVVIILVSIIFFYDTLGKKCISVINEPYQNSTLRLNAEVTDPGARFIISNNDSFDWRSIKLEIMPESTEDRFSLRVPDILAGETYKAVVAEFSKESGIRFSPSQMKLKKFWILCETSTKEIGSYQTGWN